jgi:hypothetical protein
MPPVNGQAVAISYSWTVPSSLRFGRPTVSESPFGCEWFPPCTLTISQTATPEGNATQSVARGTVVLQHVSQGVYTVNLELTVGSAKSTTLLDVFVVGPPCARGPSAFAQYSGEKSGYELYFADGMNDSVSNGTAKLVSIEGNHVTVRQPLTFSYAPPSPAWLSCISGTVDLGAIPPGTYRLTWIYDESLPPDRAPAETGMIMVTRELTFEAQLPKRRTSRR